MVMLTADMLLAGADTVFKVNVPSKILHPANGGATEETADAMVVTLRPLRLADLQRVQKAAKDNDRLASVVMVQQALVELLLLFIGLCLRTYQTVVIQQCTAVTLIAKQIEIRTE